MAICIAIHYEIGISVQEKDERGFYRYSFSCDTLKEVRDSLDAF